MLDIEIKDHIRTFINERMDHEKRTAMVFGYAPGIVIRESEVEKFIDDLWVHINTKHGK